MKTELDAWHGAPLFAFTNQPLLPHLGPPVQTNLRDMEVLCSNKGFIALDETASLPTGTKLVPCSLRPLKGLA